MIIDSSGIYEVKSFTPDYVIMCNSPKINMDRMIDSLNPKHIIADGSNYTSYVNRWKKNVFKKKAPFSPYRH
jgi:competence protein ComEC